MPHRQGVHERRAPLCDPARLLAFLAGLVVVAGLALPAPARAATLVFFGDSLTAGLGLDDPLAESFPGLIRARLEAGVPGWRVVNAGVSGETAADGLHRVDWVLRQPVDVFVLELGAHDGLRGLPLDALTANLRAILVRVRERQPRAILVLAGMRLPPSMGQDYTEGFAAAYPRVARETGAVLIPFLLEGVGGVPALNQADGIHPNAEGHRRVAETVWRVVRPLLHN